MQQQHSDVLFQYELLSAQFEKVFNVSKESCDGYEVYVALIEVRRKLEEIESNFPEPLYKLF